MVDDEGRLAAAAHLLVFQRWQGETINGTLARYALVRQRAAREGCVRDALFFVLSSSYDLAACNRSV